MHEISNILRGEKTAFIGCASFDEAPDYIIFNSTSLSDIKGFDKILYMNPDVQVFAAVGGLKNLKAAFHREFNENVAKDGAVLDLGGIELEFIVAPMLPAPDTMMTYSGGVLFSGNLFAGDEEYYRKTFRASNKFVKNAIERINNYDVKRLYTSDGEKSLDMISVYSDLSNDNLSDDVVMITSSHDDFNYKISDIITSVFKENGVSVRQYCGNIEEIYSAKAVIFGVSTVGRNAPPEIWDAVTGLNTELVRWKPYFVFGSYSWSSEGVRYINEHLKQLKMKQYKKPFECYLNPDSEKIDELYKYVNGFIKELKNDEKSG